MAGFYRKTWDRLLYFQLPNPLEKLPVPVGWFLGVRPALWKPPQNQWLVILSVFLCTISALLTNTALAKWAPLFQEHNYNNLIASFGASSVLLYGEPASPLSQPRNFILGHMLSALIGVSVMRLFCINSHGEDYLWISGALAVSCATVVMKITGTTHPPCGATALLPSVVPQVTSLSWFYLAVIIIHCLVFVGVALVVNNIYGQYPRYWFFPPRPNNKEGTKDNENETEKQDKAQTAASTLHGDESMKASISGITLHIPSDFKLSRNERNVLNDIQNRLLA